jgi:hypothetical protein
MFTRDPTARNWIWCVCLYFSLSLPYVRVLSASVSLAPDYRSSLSRPDVQYSSTHYLFVFFSVLGDYCCCSYCWSDCYFYRCHFSQLHCYIYCYYCIYDSCSFCWRWSDQRRRTCRRSCRTSRPLGFSSLSARAYSALPTSVSRASAVPSFLPSIPLQSRY